MAFAQKLGARRQRMRFLKHPNETQGPGKLHHLSAAFPAFEFNHDSATPGELRV
jgi:hypothetical protein